jgi:hypothetical protein
MICGHHNADPDTGAGDRALKEKWSTVLGLLLSSRPDLFDPVKVTVHF